MRFTSKTLTGLWSWLRVVLAGLAVVLSGCAGFTSPPPSEEPANQGSLEDITTSNSQRPIESVDALLPGAGAMPNPYLLNPREVSGGVQKLFDRAVKLHRAKNWPEAELAWQEINLAAPNLSGPFLNLGLVYEATGKTDRAVSAYEKAISVNRLNVNAYNQLAILKRKSGDFQAAETLYLQALQIWPDSPASHRNIGILYDLYMGKLPQALEHYQQYQALAAEPDDAVKGWIVDLQRRLDTNS